MLSVRKVLNNNVLHVVDSRNREYIVIGTGLGFQKKIHDLIDEKDVEKTYSLLKGDKENILEYNYNLDYNLLLTCELIKTEAEKYFKITYTNYMFFSLVDHIHGAINRVEQNISVPNEISALELEYYKKEYEMSRIAGNIIKEQLGITLTDTELNFIVLHFITYIYDMNFLQINEKVITISNDILDIIKYKTLTSIENNFHLQRFLVHLKYFIIRQLKDEKSSNNYNDDIYLTLIKNNPQVETIISSIISYLESNYNLIVEPDEQMYLLIHLIKIIK